MCFRRVAAWSACLSATRNVDLFAGLRTTCDLRQRERSISMAHQNVTDDEAHQQQLPRVSCDRCVILEPSTYAQHGSFVVLFALS